MTPEEYVSMLVRGEQIPDYRTHHKTMAELKSRLGDPRPEERAGQRPKYTLSLIREDSSSCYDASNGLRVSTDPADYAWESYSQNELRKSEESKSHSGSKTPEGRAAQSRSAKAYCEKYGNPSVFMTKEQKSTRSRIAMHKRWHVSRGIVSPTCSLCEGGDAQ
jgi:hypothetical protein